MYIYKKKYMYVVMLILRHLNLNASNIGGLAFIVSIIGYFMLLLFICMVMVLKC